MLNNNLTALVLGLLFLPDAAQAQNTTSEPAQRSTLLGIALPSAPRRITGGFGYTGETGQMAKGAQMWKLGKCSKYELLYWPAKLRVGPGEASSSFLAAAKTTGWTYTEVFSYAPLLSFVLTKSGRRVLGSLVLDRGPTLSLCELSR